MNSPFWISWSYSNLQDAELHISSTLPSHAGQHCPETCSGYHCNLFPNHAGVHEAWDGAKLLHTWDNLKCPTTH